MEHSPSIPAPCPASRTVKPECAFQAFDDRLLLATIKRMGNAIKPTRFGVFAYATYQPNRKIYPVVDPEKQTW
jgi:hypothetical protein